MYNKESNSFPMNRQSMDDNSIDEQGKIILDLCKSSNLRILNGRPTGDQHGNITRYPSNINDKPSTIDYALCSFSSMPQIKSFSVLPFSGISDHCCISTTIKINRNIDTTATKPTEKN